MPSPAVVAIAALVIALGAAVALLLIQARRSGRALGTPAAAAVPGRPGSASAPSPPRRPAERHPVDAVAAADPPTPGGVVNIARRSLVLLGRQLALVDSLERDELDPDALETLYRLDHLATRMRRYAESLLVLTGEDVGRHARAPMPLTDVVRTATSGIEQYARIDVVTAEPDDEPVVVAHRALPLAHLLAELLENATAASDPATRVRVTTGRSGAGALISVSDEGLGMTDAEIEAAVAVVRWPGGEHAAGSTQLGLHVVGRLARRLGATVEIRREEAAGLAVDVLVPADVLVPRDIPVPTEVSGPDPVADTPGPTVPEPAHGSVEALERLPVRAPLPRRRDVRRFAPGVAPVAVPVPGGEPSSDTASLTEPADWIPFSTSPEASPAPSPVPSPVSTPAPTPAVPLFESPATDILPAGRERRSRRWGGDSASAIRTPTAVPRPRARDLGGDLGRRSALASEALSELSMLSSYRPAAAPVAATPLQQRRPAEVPPPVPPPILAPAPRDPAAVGGLLTGFAEGARRGRAGEVGPGAARVPAASPPEVLPAPTPQPTPAASGWRTRPMTEEGP